MNKLAYKLGRKLAENQFHKEARLVQRVDDDSGKKKWALISKHSGRVLEWFGTDKPSEETVNKAEQRVQYFKHKG